TATSARVGVALGGRTGRHQEGEVMATTTIAVGECCPTCGRRVPKPRATTIAMASPSFPAVIPARGAEALLADHLLRRDARRATSRRGRYEHPDDYRLRREH